MHTPLFIAHRGDTKNYPENTLPAFSSALEKGADGIELDVQLNNNEVIVVHDYMYDKSEQYPLLSQVLEQFAGKCRIEIEIKSLELKHVEKIAKVIDKYRPFDLEVTSSIQPLFTEIFKYFPNDKRGLIIKRWQLEDWMPEEFKREYLLKYMQLTHTTVLHLDLDLYTKELVELLHSHGLYAHTHLKTDSKVDLQKVRELGIDQCTFDDVGVV